MNRMPYTSAKLEIEDRIARVTLNRPGRRNAIDDTLIRELTDIFLLLNRNAQSRVVILTGAGKAFCAGMDLEYLERCARMTHEENLEDAKNLSRMLHLLFSLRKPVIAAVNGPALGGGCGIAAACDFVLAGERYGKMGAPEVRLGFLPAVILPYLIKRMGEGGAKEFVLRGDVLDALQAKARGLASVVVPDEKLEATALEFAGALAKSTSPSSVALTKDLFTRFHEMTEKEAMEYAANLNALARKTDDFQKGVKSFLRKEQLEW